MHDVISLILGGGRGTRLYPLTRTRSKPAMPVAGKYRLIDIPISNCLNSDLNRIYVLTQFMSASLHRHIANTYKFDMFSRGFVEILAAQQTNESADWYQGTADAVRQNMRYLAAEKCKYVLILSGDQLYRMNFRDLMATHQDSGADVTIAALPVAAEATSGFGILKADDTGRVCSFIEKPKTPQALAPYHTPADWIEGRGIACKGRHYLASMGIYLFNYSVLKDLLLADPAATDFGKEIFPRSIKSHRVHLHLFDGYWEDLGTIKSYHEASLALASENPPFEFHSHEGVIYTRMRNLPAACINGAALTQTMVSDGCVLQAGTLIERCVLGVRSRVGRNVTLRDTVLMGADSIESPLEREANRARGIPDLIVGDNTVIERAIIDKDCRIGKNVRIVNAAGIEDGEGPGYIIREGIVVVPRGTIVPDGTVI
jgi:glucose-1-phosphate adenylyltransferase